MAASVAPTCGHTDVDGLDARQRQNCSCCDAVMWCWICGAIDDCPVGERQYSLCKCGHRSYDHYPRGWGELPDGQSMCMECTPTVKGSWLPNRANWTVCIDSEMV